MSLGEAVFLFFAALAAGLLNSVAGGGSFISFPSLLFVRIPPISANATNTAALWPGTIASVAAYWRELRHPRVKQVLGPLLAAGIVGGIIGANILLKTPQGLFMKMVPWLLLGATILFVSSRRIPAWVRRHAGHRHGTRALFAVGLAMELFIAMYVGFFGAGAGILTLAMLGLMEIDNIHAMNGLKALLVSVINVVALVVFIRGRLVVWPETIVMLIGAAIGGYGGGYYAQKVNPVVIRRIVIVIGFGMSAYFFITEFA